MKIVVGLGNPGVEYVNTRHNVGFEVVEQFAARLGWIGSAKDFDRLGKSKFEAVTIDGVMTNITGGSEKILVMKPMTFMNLSGRSVLAATQFFQASPADVMVVLDDIALPTGKLRIRSGGSSGGHNGLKDIERALGTDQYPRLRIGIDAPPPRVPQKDYVLGRWSAEQKQKIEEATARACGAIATWIDNGLNAAMNVFNAEI